MELLIFIVAALICTPLITLLHETGHAIAYLALTKPESIDVFVGSYGDKTNTIKFKVGNVNYYITRSFQFGKGGICKSSTVETNYLNYAVILLAGPVFTVLIAIFMAVIAAIMGGGSHSVIVIVCYMFIAVSVWSLIINLAPKELISGDEKYWSDGKQFLFAIRMKEGYKEYINGNQFFKQKDYDSAVLCYKNALAIAPHEKIVLRILLGLLIYAQNFDEAKKYIKQLEATTSLSSEDLINKGHIQLNDKQYQEAINTFNIILKSDLNNIIALNNLGHCFIEQKEYTSASEVLNRAIKANPAHFLSYCNMALVRLGQGDLSDAKTLIDKALEIESGYAPAYQCLTMYYLKMKDANLAELNLEKTAELDKTLATTELIAELEELKAETIGLTTVNS